PHRSPVARPARLHSTAASLLPRVVYHRSRASRSVGFASTQSTGTRAHTPPPIRALAREPPPLLHSLSKSISHLPQSSIAVEIDLEPLPVRHHLPKPPRPPRAPRSPLPKSTPHRATPPDAPATTSADGGGREAGGIDASALDAGGLDAGDVDAGERDGRVGADAGGSEACAWRAAIDEGHTFSRVLYVR